VDNLYFTRKEGRRKKRTRRANPGRREHNQRQKTPYQKNSGNLSAKGGKVIDLVSKVEREEAATDKSKQVPYRKKILRDSGDM